MTELCAGCTRGMHPHGFGPCPEDGCTCDPWVAGAGAAAIVRDTARARLAALFSGQSEPMREEFEKRVDALIATSLHEAARRMEGAGYDDDAVNFLYLLAARQAE